MEPLETAEVRDAEERLRAAMLTNDISALGDLLHDDLAFTGPDGAVVGKKDDLSAHAARRLRLTRLDLEDHQIQGDGSVAFVTVRATLAGTFDGSPCDGSYRYTRTWRKTGGHWQIVAGRVTAESSR
jgi:ketosteroid isomerase-like protein